MEQKEQNLRDELAELSKRLADPDIYSDKNYPKLAKRANEVERILGLFDEQTDLLRQKEATVKLADTDDHEMAVLARAELDSSKNKSRLMKPLWLKP